MNLSDDLTDTRPDIEAAWPQALFHELIFSGKQLDACTDAEGTQRLMRYRARLNAELEIFFGTSAVKTRTRAIDDERPSYWSTKLTANKEAKRRLKAILADGKPKKVLTPEERAERHARISAKAVASCAATLERRKAERFAPKAGKVSNFGEMAGVFDRTEEYKRLLSERMTGIKRSEESKERMSVAQLERWAKVRSMLTDEERLAQKPTRPHSVRKARKELGLKRGSPELRAYLKEVHTARWAKLKAEAPPVEPKPPKQAKPKQEPAGRLKMGSPELAAHMKQVQQERWRKIRAGELPMPPRLEKTRASAAAKEYWDKVRAGLLPHRRPRGANKNADVLTPSDASQELTGSNLEASG